MQGTVASPVIADKQTKYATLNPIGRYLLRRFLREIGRLFSKADFESVLEIGCGEGLLLHHLRPQLVGKRVFALDIEPADVLTARHNSSFARYTVASAYALPYRDRQFDLTVCCEVLEHLERPDQALREVRRITAGFSVLSVPNEPLWRLLNVLRGAYVGQWGNTPGHVNHWSRRGFEGYVGHHFDLVETVNSLPWTGVLCVTRG